MENQSCILLKLLENLKYLQKLIKDERRYVYVVNNGGLRLLENDTTCYAAGYASGRLDVGELKTWANRNESTPDYKLKSEWSYKDKKNAADIMGEPTNYHW